MDVSYQRGPNRSYMIMSGEETEGGYEQEMLRQNAVRLLLSFYMVELDQGMQVWYDITRLRSVRDIVRQEGVTFRNLYMVLNSVAAAFSMLSQYLISQTNIVIDPDTLYFDRETPANVRLCYCPLKHDDFGEQLQRFMSFFMEEVDHKKEKITELCYRLYEMCQDPVTLDELVETIRNEMPESEQMTVDTAYVAEPFTPSQNRILSGQCDNGQSEAAAPSQDSEQPHKNESLLQPEPAVVPRKEAKRWDRLSVADRIKNLLEEKFPVLAGVSRKKALKEEEEGKRAHDFTQDFVFDPDTELLQKTVFMRPDSATTDGSQDSAGFQGMLVYDGNGAENNHRITGDSFRIGSQEGENDAVLHSRVVSRHHAMITKEGRDYYIEDLNSTNGTYLNGTLLPYRDRVKLNRMDQIIFADVAYHII